MKSRRNFLKFSALSLYSLAIPPTWLAYFPIQDVHITPIGRGRVTRAIYTYHEPSFRSPRTGTLKKDNIINIYTEINSPNGPSYNPRWYGLAAGYIHSSYIQRIDNAHLNRPVMRTVPEDGMLGEVTVPYTQSYRQPKPVRQEALYRLYYGSVYWITGVEKGPDRTTWYRLTDDRLRVHYYVPGTHMRPIPYGEISPISTNIPPDDKRIEISLEDQQLTAYEGERIVLQARISTGVSSSKPPPNGIPTDTPLGRFRVQNKMPSRHMGDGELTADLDAYELPGVPWVCHFHKDGYALHGTYWHDNFGRVMSHGCVNLRNEDAKWLFRWTIPIIKPGEWYCRGNGTLLVIH